MPASPVRELEEIDPGMLPQVDELRAQVVREQRARNRRRGLVIAAVLIIATGAVALLLPKFASEQKVDIGELQLPAGPTESGAGRGETRRRTHHQAHRTQQAHARARLARRRAVGRSGIRRRPQIARRNRRHARTPKVRGRARAARGAREGARRHRRARARSADRADRRRQARAGRRRVRKRAPGARHRAQDRSAAIRKPPSGWARWPRRAASCRRWQMPRTPRRPRICPRRRPCSPTCSSEIPATSRPPKASRA